MERAEPKRYWKSLEEKNAGPEFLRKAADEFPGLENQARRMKRRDFLKVAGFSLAAAAATGCSRAPVEKAIPLLVQPEEFVPGRSLYYASTCAGCNAGCGLLAKVRDGRPIKLEGNPQHALSRGGLCAVGQASLLGLYDSQRLKQPLKAGRPSTWQTIDREIMAELELLRRQGGTVRLLTGTITSPTLRSQIDGFLKTFRDGRHVLYDPISHSAILDAHERTHGVRALPRYRFEGAQVIVGLDADFLGTWISPVEFTAGYRSGRALSVEPPRLSWHAQFEPRMTLTGAKADYRFAVSPGALGLLLTHLAARLAAKAGEPFQAYGAAAPPVPPTFLDEVAERLWRARGASLVLSGTQDMDQQILVNYINHLLGNYGATLDLERPSQQEQGSDRALEELMHELQRGTVPALFVYGANPVYDLPGGDALRVLLGRVPLLVSFAERLDETAALARYVCPDHHFLESWSDAEPVSGALSLTQPAIRPLGETRAAMESLAAWRAEPKPAYEILRDAWRTQVFPRSKSSTTFEVFWDQSLHDGYVEVEPRATKVQQFASSAVRPVLRAETVPSGSFALVLHPQTGMLAGRHAYNPWLHELPDPITKVTWDNYASLSPKAAAALGVAEGDVVRVEAAGTALELPAYLQPGQQDGVVAVALGYGSQLSRRFAGIGPDWIDARPSVGENGLVGANAAPLLALTAGHLSYVRMGVSLHATGRRHALASTQLYHTLTVPERLRPPDGGQRPIVQETTLAAFVKDPRSGVVDPEEKEDLWPADHPYTGPRWGMVIDLNACTGCSSCVIACQAENNIPVVGRDEIRRNREMHWIRIDRYYAEHPSGQVDVAFQPLLCQQCEHAPCETVCPVLATVHSEDGLNQQIYNRCIGTRYCANNCPYKARRFNWFEYARDDRLQNLVLNPDVTVRSRGVMEKCTFCVQRIQEAKIEAKRRGARIAEGDVQTACQQSCPAQAIVFGDLNDPASRVGRMMNNPRRYRVLAELNARPSVGYLALVRNREEEGEKKNG